MRYVQIQIPADPNKSPWGWGGWPESLLGLAIFSDGAPICTAGITRENAEELLKDLQRVLRMEAK